jgi:hypothetical protein
MTDERTEALPDVPLHLENTLPRRNFNLRVAADFDWLRDYFSGYLGVPGLRALATPPAEGLDVEADWYRQGWEAGHAAALAEDDR